MPIMYLIDRETLVKLLALFRELGDSEDYKRLMQHDSYGRSGRRVKQRRWG